MYSFNKDEMINKCNCILANNYNGKIAANPVIKQLPDWCDTGRVNRIISIDFCISDVIKYLWDNQIETLSCCCAHGKGNPAIVVGTSVNIKTVFELINEIDNREWIVGRWERIDYYKEDVIFPEITVSKLMQAMRDGHTARTN